MVTPAWACGKKKKAQKQAQNCALQAPAFFELPITLVPQQNQLWCWAATCTMIHHHFGHTQIEQCQIAQRMFSESTNCCLQYSETGCPRNLQCNRAQYSEEALQMAGITFYDSRQLLSWERIVQELYCNKKPIAYEYYLSGGNTHINLIIGYYISSNGTHYIIYHNPLQICHGERTEITYEQFIGKGYNTYYQTFINLAVQQ